MGKIKQVDEDLCCVWLGSSDCFIKGQLDSHYRKLWYISLLFLVSTVWEVVKAFYAPIKGLLLSGT